MDVNVLERAADTLGSDRSRYYILASFIGLVFLMGGASRPDVLSLLLLRPLSILVLGFALWAYSRAKLRPDALLIMLSCFLLLHIAQLIPLPRSMWAALPQRHVFASIGRAVGMHDIARPLTLSPATTLNSLFSLATPLAVALLLATLHPADRRRVLRGLLLLTAASGVVGMLQIAGGVGNDFYLYQVTNDDSAVGLFANRNHQALFLACSIALAIWSIRLRLPLPHHISALAGCVFDIALIAVSVVLLMQIGSRAGLIFGACALGCGTVLMLWTIPGKPGRRHSGRRGAARFWLVSAAAGLFLLGLIGFTVAMSRDASLQRFFSLAPGDEIRGNTLPVLLSMARAYFPFGSGFGTFSSAYKAVEPAALLSPLYLNEAHNDFIQLVIEGGAAAAILLVAFLVWVVRIVVKANVRAWRGRSLAAPILTLMVLFFAASSGVDYPLRVPSLMLVFIILLRSLEDLAAGEAGSGASKPRSQSRFTTRARLSIVGASGQFSPDQ